jgi:hypothetical protein
MAKRSSLWVVLLALNLLAPVQAAFGQAQPSSSRSAFRPGLRFEYFSRKIGWEGQDGEATSNVDAALASLVLAYEIQEGFSLAALAGYSSANFDGLTFRRLPISIAYETGGISGLVFGAEVDKAVLAGETFNLDVFGQFLSFFGLKKKSSLTDLVVPGTVEAKPNWMRVSVGAVLYFGRGEGFHPYFYPSYNYLWGTFELDETVEDLKGNEKKEIKGKSRFGLALGADFELSPRLRLKAEAGAYPYKGGIDYSVTIGTLFGL